MKNFHRSKNFLHTQKGFSSLAIAIFAVAVLSAILISWKAMNRTSVVGRMRSLLTSQDVQSRTNIEDLSSFLVNHDGVTGTCVVSGTIDGAGVATISSTSTTPAPTNCPAAAEFNLAGNGRSLSFVGYTVTAASGEVVRGFHIRPEQVQGDGPIAPTPTGSCFTGSTLVLISREAGVSQYRRIDSIRAGDYVMSLPDVSVQLDRLSRKNATRALVKRSTTALLNNATPSYVQELVVHNPPTENGLRLGVSGGELVTTRSHPFFVIGRGWVDAGHLHIGDPLATFSGAKISVRSMIEEAPPAVLYNLHLAEDHTYFVLPEGSASEVLVHNAVANKHEMGGSF